MEEIPHKQFLNEYFTGRFEGSESRGELYNDDPVTKDARFCGTTASMCGVESAGFENDKEKMDRAVRKVTMLHAYLFMQQGIPMLYSGDEIGQVNDYTYKEDPEKRNDSRYLHRGRFSWENAEKRKDGYTVEGRIFRALSELEKLRKTEPFFGKEAETETWETGKKEVLGILRRYKGKVFAGAFNFGNETQTACLPEGTKKQYKDMLHESTVKSGEIQIPAFGFGWYKEK